MDHLHKLKRQFFLYLLAVCLTTNVLIAVAWWLLRSWAHTEPGAVFVLLILFACTMAYFTALISQRVVVIPVKALWQAILHVTRDDNSIAAPNLDKIYLGRELVTSLSLQVYQLASQENGQDLISHRKEVIQASNIVSRMPLPLFVCNKQQLVVTASDAAMTYCQVESAQLLGKPIFDSVNLEFRSENTLEAWIKTCQENKVTDTSYWERVRVRLPDNQIRQCDLAAYYNRDNPSGTEFIVTLFDRTERYNADDTSMSFVAMAVHELRTPLTLLRGYVEVFEEELTGKLDPELTNFMQKMHASAQQLSAFVNNILNVARMDENQMFMSLNEESWDKVLKSTVEDLKLRAEVHDKEIELVIAPGLPTVAVDRVSIYEVLANLVDNAIKYSGNGHKKIIITSRLAEDGFIETTVQDFGIGIPSSVIPNLFEKFYRNHRSRAQVGGTGLGLYLSKAIVSAHGGNIWVRSEEDKGSVFGFTLQPYKQLAAEQKNDDNSGITRGAHGWIKNHSMYRR